jgi:hypothetical protein
MRRQIASNVKFEFQADSTTVRSCPNAPCSSSTELEHGASLPFIAIFA